MKKQISLLLAAAMLAGVLAPAAYAEEAALALPEAAAAETAQSEAQADAPDAMQTPEQAERQETATYDAAGEEIICEEIDLSEYLLQEGGLSVAQLPSAQSAALGEDDEEAASAAAEQYAAAAGVRQTILDGLKNHDSIIDIQSYAINTDSIFAIYTDVVNGSPSLFYVSGSLQWRRTTGGIVTTLTPIYNELYTQENLSAYEAAVQDALDCIDSGMTDLEKALALHDYLAQHNEYDLTLSKHSAFNAMVDRTSVCQGYALAYVDLLQRAGVSVGYATSDQLKHAWNLVLLDGKVYNIDVTSDDPVYDVQGRVTHTYFLISDASLVPLDMQQHKTTRSDAARSFFGSYTGDMQCTDTSYESGQFWNDRTAAVCYAGTTAYYLDAEQTAVALIARAQDGTETTLHSFAVSEAQASYARLAHDGNNFFVNIGDKVWQITAGTAAGTAATEAAACQIYAADSMIYGIYAEDGVLYVQTSYEEDPTILQLTVGDVTVKTCEVSDENKTVSHVVVGTTAQSLVHGLAAMNYAIVGVQRSDGFTTDTSAPLGTGYLLTLKSADDQQPYTVIVKGDVNGDADVNLTDALEIMYKCLRLRKIEGVYLEAAKIKTTEGAQLGDVLEIMYYKLRIPTNLVENAA